MSPSAMVRLIDLFLVNNEGLWQGGISHIGIWLYRIIEMVGLGLFMGFVDSKKYINF